MYECHITFDPISDAQADDFDSACEYYGFKRAKLYKQNGELSRKDTFATGHDFDRIRIEHRMRSLIGALVPTFKIRRAKIEEILLDERYAP